MTGTTRLERAYEWMFNMAQDDTFECVDCMTTVDEEDDLTYGFCSKCLKKSYTEANFRKFIEDEDLTAKYAEWLGEEPETFEDLELFCIDDMRQWCEWLAKQI